MPHCVFEYSANLSPGIDWPSTFRALQHALVASGEFAAADVKCRAIAHDDFAIGDGTGAAAFVALTIEILDGRSDALKATIADAALAVLNEACAARVDSDLVNVTVQIRDIHRASYRRQTG